MANPKKAKPVEEVAPAEQAIAQPRTIKQPRFIREASMNRNVFSLAAPLGTLWEDVLSPAFYAHIAPKLRPLDRIEVVAEDMTFYGEVMVLAVGQQHVNVVEIAFIELSMPETIQMTLAGHKVMFRGPQARWSVVRISDGMAVSENHPTAQHAAMWLTENSPRLS